MNIQGHFFIASNHRNRILHTTSAVFLIVLSIFPTIALGAADKPYTKQQVLTLVEGRNFTSEEIAEFVGKRKVDFQTTADVEGELTAAGASQPLIATIRGSYKPMPVEPVRPVPSPVPTAGGPMTKEEVLANLRQKKTSTALEQAIERRGVSFQLDAATTSQIKQAGGTNALIGAIAINYRNVPPPSPPPKREDPSGPSYMDFVVNGIAAGKTGNVEQTFGWLQKAIALDATRPEAYTVMGYAHLYMRGDVPAAKLTFQNAIDRGGSASFKVIHDRQNFLGDGGIVGTLGKLNPWNRNRNQSSSSQSGAFKDFREGTLFISKRGIKFEANDGKDSFDVPYGEVVDTDMNKQVGKDREAFHVRVRKGDEKGDKKNYNFAAACSSLGLLPQARRESELIVNLISSNQPK